VYTLRCYFGFRRADVDQRDVKIMLITMSVLMVQCHWLYYVPFEHDLLGLST
jgi:hypothetical protein